MAVKKLLSVDEFGNEVVRLPRLKFRTPVTYPFGNIPVGVNLDLIGALENYNINKLFLVPKKHYKIKYFSSALAVSGLDESLSFCLKIISLVLVYPLTSDIDISKNNIVYLPYTNTLPGFQKVSVHFSLERDSYLDSTYLSGYLASNPELFLNVFLDIEISTFGDPVRK